jgi:excisionase family DNA binding protein
MTHTLTTVTPESLLESLPQLLTVAEYSAIYRVSEWSTYDNIRRGRIPVVKHGRLVRIPRSVVSSAK